MKELNPNKNKINHYRCQKCNAVFITELLEEGTTPFIISCPKCNCDAQSSFFRGNQSDKPSLFWFKPTDLQLKKQLAWELEWSDALDVISLADAMVLQKKHVDLGGLVLGPSVDIIKSWNKAELINIYDKTNWGIHISGPNAFLPAESFKFASDYVAKHNDWIERKIYPNSLKDDPLMFAILFVWNEEEYGEHNPDSVDWDDPI